MLKKVLVGLVEIRENKIPSLEILIHQLFIIQLYSLRSSFIFYFNIHNFGLWMGHYSPAKDH